MMAQPVRPSMDVIRAEAAGVSVQAVPHLRQRVRLANREMSKVPAILESTLARRVQA